MRPRFSGGLATLLLTVVAVSGCARVDLANEWPRLADPAPWQPKPAACTHKFNPVSFHHAYEPIDCGGIHEYETVHVGQFKGEAAALAKAPERGSGAFGAAWADCDAKTSEYLGGQWRQARIWIGVSVPSGDNWAGGARWFRCEAWVFGVDGVAVPWSRSLKGELAASDALTQTCAQLGVEPANQLRDCREEHNAEFVGVYVSDDTFEAVDKGDSVHKKCRSLAATYVGVPDDRNLDDRTDTYYYYPEEYLWVAGNHDITCYLYIRSAKWTRSLKGGGAKALPIR